MGSQSVIAEVSEGEYRATDNTIQPPCLPLDMNLVTRLVIITGLLFTLGREGAGLRCWQCDSDETDCSDTSHHQAEQCQDSESVCLRLVLDKQVTLDCVLKEEGVNIGCREMGGDNDAQCYCDSDLCNGATTTHHISLLAIISLIIARLVLL